MYKLEGIDKRLVAFHPKYQADLKEEPSKAYEGFAEYIASFDEDAEKELLRMLGDPDTTLCQCLWHSIQKAGWDQGLDLYDNTLVHENYHGRIKKDQYNNMGRDVLMAICVGLKYRSNIVKKVFEKAGIVLNEYSDPDKTYLRIIRRRHLLQSPSIHMRFRRLRFRRQREQTHQGARMMRERRQL